MPGSAPLSASVTLSTWPDGTAKSTRLDTRAPTAPLGAPGSSSSVGNVGVLLAVGAGASLTAIPVMLLLPVALSEPSLTLVAMVKLLLKLAAGTKVMPASRVLTSAMAPEAVHTPVLLL